MNIRKRVRSTVSFIRTVLDHFVRDNGILISAAVSFYTFLALVPLALLAVAIIAFILGSPGRAENIVISYMVELGVSNGAKISDIVREVVSGRGFATSISLLIMLWAGTTAIANLTTAINVAWNVKETRGFFRTRLLSAGVLLILGLLLGISLTITFAISWIRNLNTNFFGTKPGDVPFIWGFLAYIIPVIMSIMMFTLFYRVMPNVKVKLSVALVGGVFAGLLWEAAKLAFNYYVSVFADYSKIYGSLGGVILLLIWINYSAIVTILGAEVAYVWQKRRHHSISEGN